MWFSVFTLDELITLLLNAASNQGGKVCYPKNIEYDIKVRENDTVIPSTTDSRGYPRSCGTKNANKNIIVIIRGDN